MRNSLYEDDDDWLFARRLYLKLKKIPDGTRKDRLKLKLDVDVLSAIDENANT